MMKKILGLGILAILVVISIFFTTRNSDNDEAKTRPPEVDPATRVTTQQGDVIGFLNTQGGFSWLGIPYAKAPVGTARWQAPMPLQPWQELKQALNFGEFCPQIGSFLNSADPAEFGKIIGSEDCLFLNVWSPKNSTILGSHTPGELPVMFWIHGGGNSVGHASTLLYDGANLATKQHVVVVSLNYRLGPLGWFSHSGLRQSASNPLDASGNYGTLDIIAALHWVQNNIGAFGGDGNNVTIFGESAGGVNVLSMMASPLVEDLYHKAIVQSGGFFVSSMATAENYVDADIPGDAASSREVVNKLLIKDGRASDRDAARTLQDTMSSVEIATYLRGKSARALLEIYQEDNFAGMINSPAVFGDGVVLPSGTLNAELFSDPANYNVTPVMLGTNKDEVKLFMMLSPGNIKRIFEIPYSFKDEAAYLRDAKYGSDAWKARGVDEIATYLTQSQNGNIYVYRFDWDEETSVFGFKLSKALGAAHGLEIAFVFGNFDSGLGFDIYAEESITARNQLSESMMSYWVEFAYQGNPGKGRDGQEVAWIPWQNSPYDVPRLMVLDTNQDQGIRMTSDLLTIAEIKVAFLADDSYASIAEKCQTYQQTFYGASFDQKEYSSLGCE